MERNVSIFAAVEALVVQLDRISDFGSEGWGFESSRVHEGPGVQPGFFFCQKK
jgi:hypothetical protein